jgi:hypothetical protein
MPKHAMHVHDAKRTAHVHVLASTVCMVFIFRPRSVRKDDGQSFAVKVILLERTREDRSQIQTLSEVNHPGIIKLVDWFENPTT